MPTLDFLTGFNHRVAALAATTSGSVTADTVTVHRTGGTSLKLDASVAIALWQGTIPIASAAVGVAYLNFSTLPSTGTGFWDIIALLNGGTTLPMLSWDKTTGRFSRAGGASGIGNFSVVPATGVWYRFEWKYLLTGTSQTETFGLATADGALETLTAGPTTATAASGSLQFGHSSAANGAVAFYTDVATSSVAADYPIGPISGYGDSPNAVGTPNLDAATSQFFFTDTAAPGTTAALTTTETTSWQNIDDVPLDADSAAVKVDPLITFNAISRIGSNAVASATNVPPAHAVGDLILVFAWRSTSATAPSLATGYTDLGTSTASGGAARSVRMAYKIATATSGEGSTFTNASDTVTVIYRNAQAPVIGDTVFTQGTTQAITYGADTITDHAHSWATGFIGTTLTATGNSNTAPSGMTNITSVGTAPSAGAHDTNAIRATDWASTNVTGSGAGNWITAVIEIKATFTTTQPTATWYAEYNFADESVLTSAPLAVRALVAQALDTAVASTWVAKLFDSVQGTNTEDVYNASISATPKAYQGKTFAQRPNTGGAWTLAALNGIRLRFGLTAAASGDPRLEAAMLEAAYVPSVTSLPFQGSEGEEHSDPRSLQIMDRVGVVRGGFFA